MNKKEFKVKVSVIDAVTQIEICAKTIFLSARCGQAARAIAIQKVKHTQEANVITSIAEKYGISTDILRQMIESDDIKVLHQYEYITNTTEIQ